MEGILGGLSFRTKPKTADSRERQHRWERGTAGERNGQREEREISAKREKTGDLAKKEEEMGFFLLLMCQVLQL